MFRRRKFEMESFEPRRLFSYTVTEGFTGYYEIQGNDDDDTIIVSVSMANHTFTLDQVTYPDVSFIAVDGAGGNDDVEVLSEDGPGTIGAFVSGGVGDDYVWLNFDGGVWGEDGNDIIDLSDSFYGDALGGDGHDVIMVSCGCVSANIHGGAGNDYIDCRGNYSGCTIYGDEGHDTIWGSDFDDEIHGGSQSSVLHGSAGNDIIYARNNASDIIDGGAGEDTAYTNTGDVSNTEHIGT